MASLAVRSFLSPFLVVMPQRLFDVSPQKVFVVRNSFQMCWIDTVSDATQMIDLFVRRYRSVFLFKRKTVRITGFWGVEQAVTGISDKRRPQPTRTEIRTLCWDRSVFVDMGPKAFCEWTRLRAFSHQSTITRFALDCK
jgi:hypothetical protein